MNLAEHGIITGVKPIGGWRFPQPFVNSFTTILPEHAPKGHYQNHGDKLVAAVTLFRRTHRINEGDPPREVAAFIRRASPQNDFYRGKVPDTIGKPRVREITPLIQDIREWTEEMIPQRPKLVAVSEAMERATICLTCPQNIKWRVDCDPCNKEVEQRGLVLRGAVMFELDPALLACRAHRIALQPAVFIDRDFLPDKSDKAPPECWIPVKEPTSF